MRCVRSVEALVLDVFVEQLDFIPLLAQFDTHQVAHRKHAYPTLTFDDGKVSCPDQFHTL